MTQSNGVSRENKAVRAHRGLRAQGLKGWHIGALVVEWCRQGLTDGTVNPSCPVRKVILHQYVEG